MTMTAPYTLVDISANFLIAPEWFSLGAPVSSTDNTDRQDRTKILLKVGLITIILVSTLIIKFVHVTI
jgi:hypothetical protein